jgi:hypothetical protein
MEIFGWKSYDENKTSVATTTFEIVDGGTSRLS